jgi:acyl-CoA thioesterase-1
MAWGFRGGQVREHGARRRRLQPAIGHALAGLLLFWASALAAAPPTRTVLVMGDSLSAAHGLRSEREGWVALLDAKLAATHPGWRVHNASLSGETSAGGASRVIAELVRARPAVVVIELGANDGLRGLPLQQTRIHLARMIGAAHGAGAKVLLVGMRMPPNLGQDYTRGFEGNYTSLAKKFDVALLPFLLEPIAADRASFQDDNLHPVAAAQPRLRDHVWAALEPLLD